MRRVLVIGLLALSLILSTTAGSCGGGHAGSSEKTAAETLADWLGLWKDDAPAGVRQPPVRLGIPPPPAVELSSSALAVRHSVADAFGPLMDAAGSARSASSENAGAYTRSVLCNWFEWYVEDPTHTVPDETAFVTIFLKAGLQVSVPSSPPSQQVEAATELFREAILRAKDDPVEADRNAAIAAACSIPLPS